MKTICIATTLLLLAAITACGKDETSKPAQSAAPITTAAVTQRDLAITESAVGAATSVGMALDYDPTRTAAQIYYVRLPFPEPVAVQLRIGQTVQLTSFAGGKQAVTGRIKEIRPPLNATTLSREVIVTVTNAGSWRPVGSIRGEVVMGMRRGVLVVPEHAVVLRPAGSVVYVLEGEQVRQQTVTTGISSDGVVEIVSGVTAGQRVAVDGASLLTDKTAVSVRDAPAAPAEAPAK